MAAAGRLQTRLAAVLLARELSTLAGLLGDVLRGATRRRR